MILIIGSNGSMGLRYQAILKYLDKKFSCVDIQTTPEKFLQLAGSCHCAIIASPTPSHFKYLEIFSTLKVPVLCEKPLSKNLGELTQIKEDFVSERGLNLTMMMQYKIFDSEAYQGVTSYDYFRHGNDGLAWDCLQPIGLARWTVELKEESPIWKCSLNGRKLSLGDMDLAYVKFVSNWLSKPGDDIGRLYEIHQKVLEFENAKKY